MTSPGIQIENVLIVGAGIMGSGIAEICVTSQKMKSVVLYDVDMKQLDKAKESIQSSLGHLRRKKVPTADIDQMLSTIKFTTSLEDNGIGSGLLVIEAVPEKLDLKQQVFKALNEKYASNEKVIMVTNTSSLSCRDIGRYVTPKDRFGGLHFFNPVPLTKIIEVVRTKDGTSDETHQALNQFVKDINRVGLTCKDTPGFIVNRLLIPMVYGAVEMVERGDASKEDIDTGLRLGLGFRWGPFEVLDFVGLDTSYFVGMNFIDENGNRIVKPNETMRKMIAEGKLGVKTGEGFYNYKNGEK